MGWQIEATKPMNIKLGDGYLARAQGICPGVELEIGGLKFTVDTVLFDLEGVDLILGIAWLAPLGTIMVDWGEQVLQFKVQDQWVTIQGENNKHGAQTSLQTLLGKRNSWVAGCFGLLSWSC